MKNSKKIISLILVFILTISLIPTSVIQALDIEFQTDSVPFSVEPTDYGIVGYGMSGKKITYINSEYSNAQKTFIGNIVYCCENGLYTIRSLDDAHIIISSDSPIYFQPIQTADYDGNIDEYSITFMYYFSIDDLTYIINTNAGKLFEHTFKHVSSQIVYGKISVELSTGEFGIVDLDGTFYKDYGILDHGFIVQKYYDELGYLTCAKLLDQNLKPVIEEELLLPCYFEGELMMTGADASHDSLIINSNGQIIARGYSTYRSSRIWNNTMIGEREIFIGGDADDVANYYETCDIIKSDGTVIDLYSRFGGYVEVLSEIGDVICIKAYNYENVFYYDWYKAKQDLIFFGLIDLNGNIVADLGKYVYYEDYTTHSGNTADWLGGYYSLDFSFNYYRNNNSEFNDGKCVVRKTGYDEGGFNGTYYYGVLSSSGEILSWITTNKEQEVSISNKYIFFHSEKTLYDFNGKLIMDFEDKTSVSFNDTGLVLENSTSKNGFFNTKTGTWSDFVYDNISVVNEEFIVAHKYENSSVEILNSNGEVVWSGYSFDYWIYNDLLYICEECDYSNKKSLVILNSDGVNISTKNSFYVESYHNNSRGELETQIQNNRVCVMNSSGKYGIIDSNGNIVVPLSNDFTEVLENNLLRIRNNGKSGLYDWNGSEILMQKHSYISALSKSQGATLVYISNNSKIGLVDNKGELMLDTVFTETVYNTEYESGIIVLKTENSDDDYIYSFNSQNITGTKLQINSDKNIIGLNEEIYLGAGYGRDYYLFHNNTAVWSSDNENVAVIQGTNKNIVGCVVKGLNPGKATIKVTLENGVTATIDLTVKLSIDNLIELYPEHLNSNNYSTMFDNAESICQEIISSYSNEEMIISSYFTSLKKGGAKILARELASKVFPDFIDSTYQQYADSTVESLLTEFCANESALSELVGDISNKYGSINKIAGLYKSSQSEYIKELSSITNISEKEIQETVSALEKNSAKIYDIVGKGIDLAELITEIICIRDIEIEVVNRLLELTNKNGELHQGLLRLRTKLSQNVAMNVISKYVDQEAVSYIVKASKNIVKKYGLKKFQLVGASPLSTTVAKFFVEAIVLEYSANGGVFADAIIETLLYYSYSRDLRNSLISMQTEALKNKVNNEQVDINLDDYAFLYKCYIDSLKLTLDSSIKLSKYDYLKERATECKSIIQTYGSFDMYMDACVSECLNDYPKQYSIEVVNGQVVISGYYNSAAKTRSISATTNSESDAIITIPSQIDNMPVTGISDNAFSNLSGVKGIIIPDGIVKIGKDAFANCCDLEFVVFGNNVEEIGKDAFSNCQKLKSVDLPSSLVTLGEGAFSNCGELSSVFLKSDNTNIKEDVFFNCPNLKHITSSTTNDFSGIVSDSETILHYKSPKVIGIAIKQLPNNLECSQNDIYTPQGLMLEITYADGRHENVSEGYGINYHTEKVGKCFVQVNYGEQTAEFEININPILVESIDIELSEITIMQYQEQQINTIFDPVNATNQNLKWKSDDETIATVSNGVVYANGVGSTILYATSDDGAFSDSIKINVVPYKLSGIEFATQCFNMHINQQKQIEYTLLPNDSHNYGLKFESRNVAVASVDKNGIITAHSNGITFIVAKNAEGQDVGVVLVSVGSYEKGQVITCSKNIVVDAAPSEEYEWYFMPTASNGYSFYSTGSVDTLGYIYNLQGELLLMDDGSDNGNFKVKYYMESGNIYLLKAKLYSSSSDGTFSVGVTEDVCVKNLEIISLPQKTKYIEDHVNLDYSGLKMKVIWSDNTETLWDYNKDGYYINGEQIRFDNSLINVDGRVIISCGSAKTEFNIEIIENPVEKIEVISGTTLQCIENLYGYTGSRYDQESGTWVDYFNYYYEIPSDVIIKISYIDGTYKTAYLNETVDGYSFEWNDDQYTTPWRKGDDNYITLSYLGVTTHLPVSVIANPVNRIEINSAPSREYVYGDTEYGYLYSDGDYEFYPTDMTGLSFTVYFNDGTHKTFTYEDIDGNGNINGYEFEMYYDGYNPEIGNFPITFEYMGKSADYTVVLKASTVASITVTKGPNKTEYINYYSPDFIGMELTITYTDGSTKVVTVTEDNLMYEYNPVWGGLGYKIYVDGYALTIEQSEDDEMYYVASYLGKSCEIRDIVFTEGKEISLVELDNVSWNGDGMTVKITYTDESTETLTLALADFFDFGDSSGTGHGKTDKGLLYYYIETYTDENGNAEKYKVYILDENITVKAETVLIGDVNGDGALDNLDRLTLTRYLANWDGYTESDINMVAADVNNDGSVDNLDRLILTRHLANWEGYEVLPIN